MSSRMFAASTSTSPNTRSSSTPRSEEHTSELQSHRDLHSFPTRRSSDLAIGGMLLSKDAVADVIENVRGVDFYIPKHEIIFDAILGLYSHGEPTDVIAVTDELTKSGEITRAGGAEYLHTLTGLVPTAANAGFYS